MQVCETLSSTWATESNELRHQLPLNIPSRQCRLLEFIDMFTNLREILMSSVPIGGRYEVASWSFTQKRNMIYILMEMCRLVYCLRLCPEI